MVFAILLSGIGGASGYVAPMVIQRSLDLAIPEKDVYKRQQEMLLDTATIRAAVAGELWATQKVIEHYTPMIDELAVDEDMKQHLILKLLEELPNFPMGRCV